MSSKISTSFPLDSSDDDDAVTTRAAPQKATFSDDQPLSSGTACQPSTKRRGRAPTSSGAAAGATETSETTTTTVRKPKSKKQAKKRNSDEIQTLEEVYEKITEALKFVSSGGETSTKKISEQMIARGVEMLAATSLPASSTRSASASKNFTPADAYDVFGSLILETQGKISERMADDFLKRHTSSVKVSSESAAETPYDSLGFVFSSPLFEEQRIQDVRDVDRRRTGPAMRKGVVKCRKCKSKYTDSRPKQDRSGDEPMSFLHDCRVCGEHWKTSG